MGGRQIVFGPTDMLGDSVSREVDKVDLFCFNDISKSFEAIRSIVDGEVLSQTDQPGALAKQIRAESVKRTYPNGLSRLYPVNSLPHLVGCLVGKGQRENLMARAPPVQKMRDTRRNDARFAAARSGQDHQWTVAVLRCLGLWRCQ